jgi:hypothetical protein
MSSRDPAPVVEPEKTSGADPQPSDVPRALLDVATIVGVALLAHALIDLVEYTSFVLSATPR